METKESEVYKLPEDTADEIRNKINAYSGESAECELRKRDLEFEFQRLEIHRREIELLRMKLFIKLRDAILAEARAATGEK